MRCIIILFCFHCFLLAQPIIRGYVIDEDTRQRIAHARIVLYGDTLQKEVFSDSSGYFRIESIPPGRYRLEVQAEGYYPLTINDLVVISGKEMVLELPLEERLTQLEAVEITDTRVHEPLNEMAFISTRPFNVRETDRYAGSRGDPARMASNFAGVQGADDSRNDLIIRGNTPLGVLWQMDGIRIPNPNHFAIPGTNGGPVIILNNKYLANSDFYTGAFPAEFGNAIAGVFDLQMRNGNNEHSEFNFQFGFLGIEAMVEGPINKKGASAWAHYRYATLQLFQLLNIDIGTDAVPRYQDGAFRVVFPTKKGGLWAVWGIGGKSDIAIVLSTKEKPDSNTVLYGDNDRDQYFASETGVLATTLLQPAKQGYIKTGIGFTHQKVDVFHQYIFRHVNAEGYFVVDSLPPILDYTFKEQTLTGYFYRHWKLNNRFTLRWGLQSALYFLSYIDSVRQVIPAINNQPPRLLPWQVRWNAKDQNLLLQPFIQGKYRISERLLMTMGVTALYYSINNNSLSPFEPRLAFRYLTGEKSRINLGLGIHSQIQPNYLYYYSDSIVNGTLYLYNKGMGLTKSAHVVLGYEYRLGTIARLRIETYFQYLWDIPVERYRRSSYSLINTGVGFSRQFPPPLANKGIGRNYGIEFTLERPFFKGYYYLLTLSLYDSKYQGSNRIWRNTTFNGQYIFNFLAGREFAVGKRSAFNIGVKITRAGGRRYGDVDSLASAQALDVVYKDNENYNKYRFRDYFRTDIRLNFRGNGKKITHEIGLDLINIFNTKNILTLTYVPYLNPPIREEYQLGFLPIFYYRLDF